MNKRIDRLDQYMKYKMLNDHQITVMCGLGNGLLNKARAGQSDIGLKAISKIANKYPDLNQTWIITGEGNMINGYDPGNRRPKEFSVTHEEMTWDIYKLLCAAYVKTQFEKDQTYLFKGEELCLDVNESMLHDLFKKATQMVNMFEYPEKYENERKAYLKAEQESDDRWAALWDEMHKNL